MKHLLETQNVTFNLTENENKIFWETNFSSFKANFQLLEN